MKKSQYIGDPKNTKEEKANTQENARMPKKRMETCMRIREHENRESTYIVEIENSSEENKACDKDPKDMKNMDMRTA